MDEKDAPAAGIMEQNRIDDQAFINDVGAWTNKNFTYHNPFLGMVEELGEACHCLLKRAQKIRGYDDPDKFRSEYSDALADFAIYAAHFAFLHAKFRPKYCLDTSPADLEPDQLVVELMRGLADLKDARSSASHLKLVMSDISKLASLEGLNLREITFNVWEKIVSKRDWVANKNGH